MGLVGAGRFAAFLAAAAADVRGMELRRVADPDHDRAGALADLHGARVADSWTALLEDPAVDAVAVASPPSTHAEVALAALDGGRHVFCEKPVAIDPASAAEVAAATVRTGRVLVVDHVLRYNPLLAALVRLRDELLGPVQRFCFENDASDEDLPPDHWFWDEKCSGGIFVNTACTSSTPPI